MPANNSVSRRRIVAIALDVAAVLTAYALAFAVRFDFTPKAAELELLLRSAPSAALTFLLASYYYGVHRGMERSVSLDDVSDVFRCVAAAAVMQWLILTPLTGGAFPRSVLLLWPLLSLVAVALLHAAARAVRRYWLVTLLGGGRRRTAVIVGVQELGELVYQSLRSDPTIDYRVAAFFDDDQSKWGMRLHGVPVLGGVPAMAALLRRAPVDEMIIAVGEGRAHALAAVAEALAGVEKRPQVRVVPTLDEMLRAPRRAAPRKVQPADLLNRRVASLDAAGIARAVEGKVVLVTGAGGTIGGELSRQLAQYRPSKIVLLENHATALFYREAELRALRRGADVVAALGDVRDEALLERLFGEHRPQVVFHAAAHKHVHQLESNIHEGVSNNLLGTYRLALAAERHGTESFVLISTDKAVRPSCVMGATKRAAEAVISNMARTSRTRFAAVRFGNVLGSSGSVLKIFQEQIEKGEPITLTHPDVTRYFMTVEEAVGLVLQASAMAKGGEIFVLKMGEPVRIMDMARSLILLSGLEPGRDIEIRLTGLKPGEKLSEELIEDAAGQEQSEHPEILVLRSENRGIEGLGARMAALDRLRHDSGNAEMILALSTLVPTFTADPVHRVPDFTAAAATPVEERFPMRSDAKRVVASALLAGFLLAGGGAARAATYYVSPAGSNTGAGTITSPFLTIQKAADAARAGDTVIVRDGTYGPTGGAGSFGVTMKTGGTSAAWITLKAEHPGMAILDCQKVCQAYINLPTAAASYWVIQGLDIRNTTRFGIVAYPAGASNLRILGNLIHHIGNVVDNTTQGIAGVFTDANANVVVDGNVIHDVGRTSVLTGTHDHGIYTHGLNMVITNNVFYNALNGWHIQTASGFSGTIANNTFFGPNTYPGKVGQIVVWDPEGAVAIRNNIFYNPGGVAIANVGVSFTSCAIDHNLVYSRTATVGLIDTTPAGCSVASNILNKDPLLTTPTVPAFDFHLQAGSPAIGAGVILAAVPADFGGAARGSRNDLGAFQYGGAATGGTPPPATTISGLASSGVGQTGATVNWTTNNAADGQVQYGPTSAYGTSTPLSTALTTTHSAAPSGLAAGTLYHYKALSRDASGAQAASADATFTTSAAPVVPPSAGCLSSAAGGTWQNGGFAAQSGSFTAEFDATPSAANIDGVAGLANGAASSYSSLAAAVRFNNTGMIDARNGSSYAASASVPYVAGMTYHVRMPVNVPAHTYSVYVKQGTGAETAIGTGFAFRTEQAAASTLSNAAALTSVGSFQACAVAVSASAPPTTISGLAATNIGPTSATLVWTTNNSADSQVQYGPTTAYGVTTTLNATALTAHSVAIGGLTAGSLYHYHVLSRDASGVLATSPDATFTTSAAAVTPPPGGACVTSSASSWQNVSLGARSGSFTVTFDVTPSVAKLDAVAGLSNGAAAAFSSLAAAVRFNGTGTIDARNGGVYAAAASIPYSAGVVYHARLAVNLTTHTYSAYVAPGTGAEQTVALNYAFRTEQAAATALNNLAAVDDTIGSVTVCNAK